MNPLTTAEVATRLGVSVAAIHKWHREQPGFPEPVKIRGRRRVTQLLWSEDAIRTWLSQHPQPKGSRAIRKAARRENVAVKTHGTRGGYVEGCRCEPCCDANSAYLRKYRQRKAREKKLA
jgi:predicted DNA-binding transcriptional regulator AlpA